MVTKISQATMLALQTQLRAKNPDGLMRMAAAVHAKNPNSLVSRYYTAKALMIKHEYAQASDVLETIILPFPRLRRVFLDYLDCLQHCQRRIQWQIQAARFLEFHQSDRIRLALGRSYFKSRDWNHAYAVFSPLLKTSKNAGLWRRQLALPMGKLHYELGNFSEALACLEKCSKDAALVLRARILAELNHPEQAIQCLDTLSVRGRQSTLRLRLSLARKSSNRDLELTVLQEMLSGVLSPNDRVQVLARLVHFYMQQGDWKEVYSSLRDLRALKPGSSSILKLQVRACEQLGLLKEGRQHALRYLRMRPFDAANLRTLSFMCLELGFRDEAIRHLKAAWLCGVKDKELRMDYATLCLEDMNHQESKRVLESVIEEFGPDSRAYGMLAAVWKLSGNHKVSQYYEALMKAESARQVA